MDGRQLNHASSITSSQMAGLVSYGSSDEEENLQVEAPQPLVSSSTRSSMNGISSGMFQSSALPADHRPEYQHDLSPPAISGPVLGPINPVDQNLTQPTGEDGVVESPYSANRALLRDLTLPTAPNYDIPTSPPGSPDASTNSKFKHFLELKRQGIHFNEKLAKSSALRNPSLMQKLMEFSGISETGQYSTILSRNLWDPTFPGYAYKEELAKSQQSVLKKREDTKTRCQRDALDFVPAGSGQSSRKRKPGYPEGRE
jgi:hypothetical protein